MTVTVRSTASAASAPRQVLTVGVRSWSERRRGMIGWSIALAMLAGLQLVVYPSVARSAQSMQEFVNQWPETFREAFSLDAYATGAGFLNAELFSLMVPLVMTAIALSGAAGATAGEEERGTADLLFSLPVTRARVLLGKVAATLAAVVVVAMVGFVAVALGAPLVDLDVSIAGLAAATLMTSLLGLVFGALGLVVGVWTGHRAAALGVGIGAALAAFLVHALAPMADWMERWQVISPFHWALDATPLVNGVDWAMAGLMIAVCVALVGVSAVLLNRRDLAGR